MENQLIRLKLVVNGAGASAMACANLFKKKWCSTKKILQWWIEKVLFIEEEKI